MDDIKYNRLYNSLAELCNTVIEKINEHKHKGNLQSFLYQTISVKEIDFQMETYFYDWDKINYFEFYEWRTEDISSFLENEIYNLPEFEEATKELIDVFDIPEYLVKKSGLYNLLLLIIKQVPNGNISFDNINYYIQIFISDYESYKSNNLIIWNIQIWLRNIYIESDAIEIDSNVLLRKPTKEELSFVSQKNYHFSELDQLTSRELPAGAVLSFTIQAGRRKPIGLYPKKIKYEIETWLNIFSLFKPSNIIVVSQTISPVSIFEYQISKNFEQPFDKFWQGKVESKDTSSYKFYLKREEEALFRSFVQDIKPIIKEITPESYLRGDPYDLAFHRYNDSLLKSEVNAYKVLSAITSLEALLSDGNTEITFKIRLRVAKLLSFFNFDAIKVSDKIRDAYTLRSKLVHGAKLQENKKDLLEFARNHTHEILYFNRICLLIFLFLKKKKEKDNIIKLIDNSFIDLKANTELKDLIEQNVKIAIVNPYQ